MHAILHRILKRKSDGKERYMLINVGGSAEGGEASPRSFASMCFAYYPARPATSERGAADDGKHAFSMIEVDLSLLEA